MKRINVQISSPLLLVIVELSKRKRKKKNRTPKLYLSRLKKKNSYLNIIWIYTPKSDLIIIPLGYLCIYQVLFYHPIRVTLNIENVSCLKKQRDKFGLINNRRKSCKL